ncbi:hypothetical protein [Mucilaginibacter sp.]
MNLFYFNPCVPTDKSDELIITAFSDTYREYDVLKKKFGDEVDGIVTENSAHELFLAPERLSLAQCIESLERAMKIGAYSYFTKFPVKEHFTEIDVDGMVLNEYKLTVNGKDEEAYYLKVVADNSGFAFTLGLSDDLKVHPLIISGNDGSETNLNNLFGVKANTEAIEEIIQQSLREKLGNFDRLINMVGENFYSPKFKNGFEKLDSKAQTSVIDRVDKAIKRKGASKFFADNDIVKDVTSEKEKEIRVCELRIFDPTPLRVYFYETETEVILGSVEKKPTKEHKTTAQDNQIKAATSLIKQTLKLNSKNKK